MFKVRRETNTWNRWGQRVDYAEQVVLETESLEEAFRFRLANDDLRLHAAAEAVRYRVVDEAGKEVPLVDLYERVVGPGVFGAQCEQEGWHINLDDWLQGRIDRGIPLDQKNDEGYKKMLT